MTLILFLTLQVQKIRQNIVTRELYKKLLSNDGILNKISNFVSERDRLVTILKEIEKKTEELDEIEVILGGDRKSEETNEVLTFNDEEKRAGSFLA